MGSDKTVRRRGLADRRWLHPGKLDGGLQASVPNDLREIQHAVSFLIANKNEDGSWPTTSRTAKDQVPIIDFGSAWATLGLTRTVPK